MVLRMPCPTKRQGSDNWYYRRTIPADIRRILAKLPREKRPPGWYKTHISISLGTPDRALAKAKYAEVSARVERQIKALREGPKPLSPKQLSALSGLLYRAFAERLEEDPVLSADQWRDVAESNREARRGGFGTTPSCANEVLIRWSGGSVRWWMPFSSGSKSSPTMRVAAAS